MFSRGRFISFIHSESREKIFILTVLVCKDSDEEWVQSDVLRKHATNVPEQNPCKKLTLEINFLNPASILTIRIVFNAPESVFRYSTRETLRSEENLLP